MMTLLRDNAPLLVAAVVFDGLFGLFVLFYEVGRRHGAASRRN